MKRIIASLIIACLLLSTFMILPVSAYGTGYTVSDEEAYEATFRVRVGAEYDPNTKYFKTIEEAIRQYADYEPRDLIEVVLLGDHYSEAVDSYSSPADLGYYFHRHGANYSIDLNGHTWTVSGLIQTPKSLTVKNGTFVFDTKIFMAGANTNWTFEDLTVRYIGSDVSFNMNTDYGTVNATFDGVTYTDCSGVMMLVLGSGTANINIVDSTFVKSTAWNDMDNAILSVRGNATANVDIKNTSMTVAPAAAVNGDNCQVIKAHSNATLNLSVDANTTMEVASACATNSFIGAGAGSVVKLTDNGATWKAAAATMAAGVTLPTATAATGETVIGYKAGDLIVPNGKTGCQATVDTAVSFKKVSFAAADFANVDGASIRLNDPYGIRFTTNVSKALIDVLGESATYGTLVIPTELLGNAAFTKAVEGVLDIPTEKWAVTEGETYSYRAALVGLEANKTQVTAKMSATAYFTVEYADGTTATFYAVYAEANNARSLYDVADAAKDTYTGNAIIANIIAIATAA